MRIQYAKPEVSRIELELDQVALTACKYVVLSEGPNPPGADCETGTGRQCFDIGY